MKSGDAVCHHYERTKRETEQGHARGETVGNKETVKTKTLSHVLRGGARGHRSSRFTQVAG